MPDYRDIRAVSASGPETFQDALHYWADRTPDAPAFLPEEDGAVSFAALASRVDAVGLALNARGFGRGDRIAVVHPGGPDYATAILGIWDRATVMPLSPRYRLGEYAMYLRDLRADAVVIAEGMDSPARAAAERLGLPTLDLVPTGAGNNGHVRLEGAAVDRPHAPGSAKAGDVAVVLMTSGTTSESKLVPVRHSHIIARAEDSAEMLGYTRNDRGASLMQLYHWGGFGSMTYTLFAGASSAHFPGPDLVHIFRSLERIRPTFIAGPYTAFHTMLAQAERLRGSIEKIRPGLRMLRTGAGHLDTRVAAALEDLFRVPVIQAYGSSETAFMACEPQPPAPRKAGSVGLPRGTKIAILDDSGRPLPANEVGAVAVKGPKVFDGYEDNPAANAEAFVDGWFRIGDLGYFDDDGYLFLTGRIREVINRGGQKITPAEIDAAIMAHPAVASAAAFPVPHPTLGDDVAAAVVLRPGATLDGKTLSAALRARLGDAKVPRHILFVDDIPKGKTGKVQRYKLAATFGLDGAAPRPAGAGKAAATPTEATLQRIWAETLKLPSVPLDADFFSLGGDSLLAVELFLRIEEALGRRLPRAALFEASTVAEMARHIDAAPAPRCLVPIQTGGHRPALFLVHDVFGQVLNFRALAQHLGPDQPVYGLQLAGLDGTEAPLARVEDMAARYLSEMRAVQPTGPYHVGGFSMGGLVAYEMARQLRRAGEEVALLALLDTFPRHGPRRSTLAFWFTHRDNTLHDARPLPIFRYVARGLLNVALNLWIAMARRLFGLAWRFSERFLPAVPKALHRPVAASLLASRRYRMRPYGGDAVLFMAEDFKSDHDHVAETWRRLLDGRLEIRPVTGSHREILDEPHVRALARHLSECLVERTDRQAAAAGQDAAA